ncbi:PEP-CTERM sorting domain-containing protein [Mariniblastus sp.]|nr:PEP-CTERM sorting domain-containing protein [Mariniblastus sp.]
MRKILSLMFAALATLGFASQSIGDIVVEYTTAGSTSSIAANSNSSAFVTADDLVAGSGLNEQTFSTFNFTGWDTTSTTFAAAVAANDFWTWGFDVSTPGTSIALTTLETRLDRSGSGPDDFEIQGSVNGGTPISLLTFDFEDSGAGVNFTGVDISALGTVVTGDSVEFTFAAFNSESDAGSFDLETLTFPGGTDSLQVNGDFTSAVPEPTCTALLGLAGLAGVVRRRK